MKFRNVLISAALAVVALTACAPASATDLKFSGSAGIENNYLYRGVNLSPNSDLSLNAAARFDNVLISGLYLRGQLNTLALEDFDVNTRSDVGIGYTTNLNPRWSYDVSVNRVTNPGTYAYNFTEARGELGYAVTNNTQLFGQVGYQLGANTDRDTYAAIGVDFNDAFHIQNFKVTGLVSGVYYNDSVGHSQFNNAEVTGSYLVRDRVILYGKYSNGGDYFTGDALDNQTSVGVKVVF